MRWRLQIEVECGLMVEDTRLKVLIKGWCLGGPLMVDMDVRRVAMGE